MLKRGLGPDLQASPEHWEQKDSRTGPGLWGTLPDTHPRPRQPSLRLTSLCSKPSSRERSSGEKESGSSTAYREKLQSGPGKGPQS